MPKEDEQEDSELEEEIKEDELEEIVEKISEETPESNIKEGEFQEFLQTDSSSPVLERTAQAQEPINLEQGVATSSTNNEEDDQVKYSTTTYEQTKKDYNTNEERITPQQMQPQKTSMGEVAFTNPEAQQLDRPQQKEDYQLETKAVEREKSNLPFQQQERKYKPAKFNQ